MMKRNLKAWVGSTVLVLMTGAGNFMPLTNPALAARETRYKRQLPRRVRHPAMPMSPKSLQNIFARSATAAPSLARDCRWTTIKA